MWFKQTEVSKFVECDKCRCLMQSAYKTVRYLSGVVSYCGKCAPAYDEVIYGLDGEWHFYTTRRVEVKEDGTPIVK